MIWVWLCQRSWNPGIVDGTPIIFAQRTGVCGREYWGRKKRYYINLQNICDDKGKILNYICSWPGSVFDSTVWENGKIAKKPTKYFPPDEFVIASKKKRRF